ncbi:MAG: sigma-54-dependent Fis family transcriptional regulator [Bacteriovoracaceae bacterium]|nr:sigma-54-dependent Fis family transcriptional regulator [Bacteriovoracaceae bacterium]
MDDLKYLQSNYSEVAGELDDVSELEQCPQIIIVEDDKVLGLSLKKYLAKKLNTEITLFSKVSDCLEALALKANNEPFCLVTDISLDQGSDGLLLVDILKEKNYNFISIVMTGFASIETAIAATKKGVYHYLTKPFDLENLYNLLVAAIENKFNYKFNHQQKIETAAVKGLSNLVSNKLTIERPNENDLFCGMIGRSKIMREVFERIKKVSQSDSTILITGPSGTGKELVANAIHKLSERRKFPKVSVNCGAIPGELLESELFGHIKGAFTGAISTRKGRFEVANNGSIFLDEIGDMPLILQVKLLRVIQGRQVEPVGGSTPTDVDVRIIAATHRDLDKAVQEGKFREDLFYRLNVIPIKLPALKERREDIPLLIGYFLERFVSADKRNEIEISDQALELLLSYDWPGNVRELENVIERLVILRGGNKILPEDLPAKIYRHNPLASSLYKNIFELPEYGIDLKKVISDIEDSLIMQALGRTNGNKNQASRLLSMNRTTLIEKLKKKSLEA